MLFNDALICRSHIEVLSLYLPMRTEENHENHQDSLCPCLANVLIIVLFLKIMLIMDFDDFLFLNFSCFFFSLLTCAGPFASHQCAPAHRF
jgi:hypothetical protein